MGSCIDCGNPTGGLRCRPCADRVRRADALADTAGADYELLRLVDTEGVTPARIAIRYGVSRTRAYIKIREARQRQSERMKEVPPIDGHV